MTPEASVLDRAGEGLGDFLPRLGGALALLVVGLLLARVLASVVRRLLNGAGLDAFVDRAGTGEILAKAGLGHSLTALVAASIRIAVSVVVVFAALSLLGLQFLSDSLNEAVLFLPKVAAAGGLVLAGAIVSGALRQRVDRVEREMDLPFPLGRAAQITVFAVFAITAAAQITVSTALLMVLVGILLTGAVTTVAIAFGLGGQHVARQVTAGRYLRASYEEGDEISFDDTRGRVVRVESAFLVLEDGAGDTVRVPNDLLLSRVVTMHDQVGD